MADELDKIFDLYEADAPNDELSAILNEFEKTPTVEEPLASSSAGAVQKDDNYLQRVGGLISKRMGETKESLADLRSGEIRQDEYTLQVVGKGVFGTLFDIAGETVATILSTMTPDEAEDYIKEVISSKTNELMSTDTAKKLLGWYGSLDRNDRKNIESVANILFGYSTGLTKNKNILGTDKAAKWLDDSAGAQKLKRVRKKLEPIVLDQRKKTQEARTLDVDSVNQAKRDTEIINTVLSVKNFKPSNSSKKNIAILKNEASKLDDELMKGLAKNKTMFSNNTVRSSIAKEVDTLINKSAYASTKKAQNFMKELDELVKNNPVFRKGSFTPKQLVEARRAFDADIKALGKTDEVFKETGVNGSLIRAYRDGMNKIIDDIEIGRVDTKAIRQKQSKLIEAQVNIARNTEAKSKTRIALDYAKSHPFLAASPLAGGGMFASPLIQAGLGTGALLYGGYKAAPYVKQLGARAIERAPIGAPVSGMFYGKQEDEDIAP